MASIRYRPFDTASEIDLRIPNAETLQPVPRDIGATQTAMDGTREEFHFRREQSLRLRIRAIPDCMMDNWLNFIERSSCEPFVIDLDGVYVPYWTDAVTCTRDDQFEMDRDGVGHWLIGFTFHRVI